MKLQRYLPHTHRRKFGLTTIIDGKPWPHHWIPVKFIQLIGGKKWSLAIVLTEKIQNEEGYTEVRER